MSATQIKNNGGIIGAPEDISSQVTLNTDKFSAPVNTIKVYRYGKIVQVSINGITQLSNTEENVTILSGLPEPVSFVTAGIGLSQYNPHTSTVAINSGETDLKTKIRTTGGSPIYSSFTYICK